MYLCVCAVLMFTLINLISEKRDYNINYIVLIINIHVCNNDANSGNDVIMS